MRNHSKLTQASLCDAALHGNLDVLEQAIQSGVDLDKPDANNKLALHIALFNGQKDFVKRLIDAGANINKQSKHDGATALIVLARIFINKTVPESLKQIDVFQYLIDHGADLNRMDNFGHTVLHFAAFEPSGELCRRLLQQKIDLNALTNANETPLNFAVFGGYPVVVKLLLGAGAAPFPKCAAPMRLQSNALQTAIALHEAGIDISPEMYEEVSQNDRHAIDSFLERQKLKSAIKRDFDVDELSIGPTL